MNKIKKEFPSMLKSWRKEKNISKYRLAQLLGVSPTAISKWESGVYFPSTLNYMNIVKIMKDEQ